MKKWFNQLLHTWRENILVWHARWVEYKNLGMPPLQTDLPEDTKIMAFYKMAYDEDLVGLLGYLRKRYERQILINSHPARIKSAEKMLAAAHYRRDFILDLFQEGRRYGKLKQMDEYMSSKSSEQIDSIDVEK